MLSLKLFGPPRCERDEINISISRRKGVALLSYLAQTNRPASRETLAALFWPDHDQSESLKGLRRELARLKKSLGHDSIQATPNQITFNDSAVVDTLRFNKYLHLVREHNHFPDTDCSSCLDALNGAVNLYTDDFMAGFNLLDCLDFDTWQAYQRENLRQQLGHAFNQLTRWYYLQRQEDQSIHYCWRWLALNPLNEKVRRVLMQIYAQAGRPADALQVYEEGVKLLKEDLGIKPARETYQLYQEIHSGRFPKDEEVIPTHEKFSHQVTPPVIRKRRSNLPQQPTPFVGRVNELMMIQQRLQEPACRLLTLVGPAGMGKTRLALEVGQRILDEEFPLFMDGVLFVPLTAVNTSEGIANAMLEAAGVPYYDNSQPIKPLLDFLRDKKMLFILDNLEHLLECGELLSTIIEATPDVRVLATSRVALRLQAEWFHPVCEMSVPPPNLLAQNNKSNANESTSPRNYDSVLLFEQCARSASPDFSLSEELESTIQICRSVEGMPLALEMAASWLRVMDASAIADELKHNKDLLTSRFANIPKKHQSIQVVFKQTWDMLKPTEQESFARLSVFAGSFTREAARQVANADLFLLSSLIEKALLYTTTHGCYRLHELLRQFAAKKLQATGLIEESRAAHSSYYMRLLAELESDLKGAQQLSALKHIKDNLENIRLAWNLALEQANLKALARALETIYLYFYIRGRNQEGVDFLQTARHKLSPKNGKDSVEVWGRILSRICMLKTHLPPDEHIETEIQTALSVAHQYHDQMELAFCNFVQGVFNTLIRENATEAIQAYEQALQSFRNLNDIFNLVQVLMWLGFCHGNSGRLDLYYKHNRDALDLAHTTGHRAGSVNALSNLVAWDFCIGDYAVAETHATEVNQIAVAMDLPNMITHSKAQLCLVNFLKGDLEGSGNLARETYELASEIRFPLSIAYGLTFLGLNACINGNYTSGKRLGEESLTMNAPKFGIIMAHWAIALACCGLEQDESAWTHTMTMLEMAHRAGFIGMTTWPLPILAALQEHAGQKEVAVQLLALAQSHPLSPTGWQNQWDLLARLRDNLKAEMGEEKFSAVWELGQTLDLESVVTWALDCQNVSTAMQIPQHG